MKILLINELRSFGGTEIQVAREIKLFSKMGHEMYLLTFDSEYPLCCENSPDKQYNIPLKFSNFKKMYHRIFYSKKYYDLVNNIIKKVSPDFIHINHTKNIPLDVFLAVKNIPTVQTLRDYSFICPKETCIDKDGNLCKGYMYSNCVSCIGKNINQQIKARIIKRLNYARINAVDKFVSPSQALANACTNNGISTQCLNNPFDFSIICKKHPSYSSNIYLYYGKISEEKGVTILVKAFKKFNQYYPDTRLIFAGSISDSYVYEFEKICENSCIEYKGVLKNSDIMNLYKEIYCVVVPSLWIENYPNTVLEAIANKTLVIGSNRGGIPELIKNKDFLFDILDIEDIIRKLILTYKLDELSYINMVEKSYIFIKENNALDKYYKRLWDIYKSIK